MIKNTAPLDGIQIIELSGIGPVPYAGQLFADMGANVTRIEKPGAFKLPIENRDKTCISLDLQTKSAQNKVLKLIKTADAVIEGSRPGVMEKLGLGPQECLKINPKLIYGRMTGWGQTGPWANKAGHDINYIGLTGALHAMGKGDRPPTPPLNLVGDYGGGSQFLVMGILAALLGVKKDGRGTIIDTAIIDGTASMMGIVNSLDQIGMWTVQRSSNLLDGSRPFYRCYATKDAGFMAIGCLEPKFYLEMLTHLGLDVSRFGGQDEASLWLQQIQTLTHIFKGNTRKHWEAVFENSDACVTPVLSYKEAPHHPHNKARKGGKNGI